MSVGKHKVMEVSIAANTVVRAVKQLSKSAPERTEAIAVKEFTKAVKSHKENK